MPVPKVFKKFASMSTLKGATTTSDVPVKHKKNTSPKTLVMAAVVPAYSENLAEAWVAEHKELPKAQGVEKFLNRIGASVTDGPMYFSILK